jgi:hypothetical protein
MTLPGVPSVSPVFPGRYTTRSFPGDRERSAPGADLEPTGSVPGGRAGASSRPQLRAGRPPTQLDARTTHGRAHEAPTSRSIGIDGPPLTVSSVPDVRRPIGRHAPWTIPLPQGDVHRRSTPCPARPGFTDPRPPSRGSVHCWDRDPDERTSSAPSPTGRRPSGRDGDQKDGADLLNPGPSWTDTSPTVTRV